MKCKSQSGCTFLAIVLLTSFPYNSALAQGQAANVNSAKANRKAAQALAESWVPDDIDHAIPPVVAGAACSLPEVLSKAGRRVEELIKNLDWFTATEVLDHQAVDRSGRLHRPTTVKFEYLVSIAEEHDGFMRVEELRNRSRSLNSFPGHIATNGTPSLVLIFHPRYIGSFKTTCEGLGEWKGQPAWQLRFEQRADRPNRICSFVVAGRIYPANMRGRAWILADSFQIARLDTNQQEFIPQIRLRRSHLSVEYGPVTFPRNQVQLWLPSSAEVYMDFQGQRFYRKHSFTEFKLFSVNTQYEVSEPTETQAAQHPVQ